MNILKRCLIAVMIAVMPTCAVILCWLCLLCTFDLMEVLRSVPLQGFSTLSTLLGIVMAVVLPIKEVNEMIS